jgi:hypothetical protein
MDSGSNQPCCVQSQMGDATIVGDPADLASSTAGESWPPEPVREVIEVCRSRDLERGFEAGVRNQRGVTVRLPTDGGEQERALAAQYRADALACVFTCSMFKMAIHRDALPKRIGLDCTFGGTFECAAAMRARNPNLSRGQVFLAMVTNREVVISYDAIPAADLRVCTEALRDNSPSDWPPLLGADLKNVEIFKPDLVGNVQL